LLLTPFKSLVEKIPLNLVTGLIVIPFAYFIGVIISGLSHNVEKWTYKRYKGLSDPRERIHPGECKERVQDAYKNAFHLTEDVVWSTTHFYISRALIREHMPKCAAISDRQNSLWQIRRNGIVPIIMLGLTGLAAGVKLTITGSVPRWWGLLLSVLSLGLPVLIVHNLMKYAMYNNRQREVAEICSALLVFDCAGQQIVGRERRGVKSEV